MEEGKLFWFFLRLSRFQEHLEQFVSQSSRDSIRLTCVKSNQDTTIPSPEEHQHINTVGSVTTLHIGYYYTDSPEKPSKMLLKDTLECGVRFGYVGLAFILTCVKSNQDTNVPPPEEYHQYIAQRILFYRLSRKTIKYRNKLNTCQDLF